MGNLIDINGLRKSYNEKAVLKGINLTVNRGEVIAIIGASGSGKSTLVRCIANLEPYQNGSINICGKKNSDYKSLSGILGMVFQNYNLFPHYTVLENITQPLQVVMKYSVTDAEKRAKKLLERVRLIDYINQYPSTLSGGQKQRLAIASILAMGTEILIFDEATSMLDPVGKKEVLSIKLDPEVVDPDDIEMLQDLIMTAINEANRKAQEKHDSEINKITGGINIPGL